jgi:hypothetical protein
MTKANANRLRAQVGNITTSVDRCLRDIDYALSTIGTIGTEDDSVARSNLTILKTKLLQASKYGNVTLASIPTDKVWMRSNGQTQVIKDMNSEHLYNALHRLVYVQTLAKKEFSDSTSVETYHTAVNEIRAKYNLNPVAPGKVLTLSLVELFPVARDLMDEMESRDLPILVSLNPTPYKRAEEI